MRRAKSFLYFFVPVSICGHAALAQVTHQALAVNPGDTVVFTLSDANMAPHTVTFLNGNMSPDDVLPVPQDNGPPLLVLNFIIALQGIFPSQN